MMTTTQLTTARRRDIEIIHIPTGKRGYVVDFDTDPTVAVLIVLNENPDRAIYAARSEIRIAA